VDNNGDGVVDDRPAFAPGITAANANCRVPTDFVSPPPSTVYTVGESYSQIPINFCTGPNNVSFNVRLARTFGFGPKTAAALARDARNAAANQGGPGGPGGPGGGPGGGRGPGGGGFGGGGGGRGGGGGGGGGGFGGGRGSNTGRKYNLSLGLQALNRPSSARLLHSAEAVSADRTRCGILRFRLTSTSNQLVTRNMGAANNLVAPFVLLG
jgi:hypothetical protein